MLNWLSLATALALSGGCVTVPDKTAGIDAGSTSSALNPNGTKFSRFWKRQTDKFDSLAQKKPAPNRINTTPPSAEFFLTMAVAQEQAGKLDAAEDFYKKALADDPKSLAVLTSYAHFEDRRRHLVAATKLYKKALAKHPEEASVYNDLGLCYQRRGLLPEAVTMLSKAIELQPERPLYRNNLATVLVDSGRTDEALGQLMIVNTGGLAHYNLGCLLHRKGNDAQAAEQFQLALVDDPTMRAAEQWLAKLGPQPPQAEPDATEQRLAQQPRPLVPMQVELGPTSDGPQAQIDDGAGPGAAPPAAGQPTVTRPIPVQAVSRQTVRQRPVSAPVDEIAPPPTAVSKLPNAGYSPPPAVEYAPPRAPTIVVRPVDPPVAEDAHYETPPGAEALPVEVLPAESLAAGTAPAAGTAQADPPVTELLPGTPPTDDDSFFAGGPSTEPLPGAGRATESLFSPPPSDELAPGADQAGGSLYGPPPVSEALPAQVPAATAEHYEPATQRGVASSVQYPQDSVRSGSAEGVEMLPAAPLPDATLRPAPPARRTRLMSQPDELEPLPLPEGVQEQPAV
ncbi:MAG TPA: tetratricopeptide repeat protein [Pirellulales bacterium]